MRAKEIIEVVVERVKADWLKEHAAAFLHNLKDVQPNGRRSHRFWQRGGGYDRNRWSAAEIHEKMVHPANGYLNVTPGRKAANAAGFFEAWLGCPMG